MQIDLPSGQFLSHLLMGMLLLLAFPSWSDTVIERQDTQGDRQTILMGEHRARFQGQTPEHYMLIDLETKQVYIVDSLEKQILEMPITGRPHGDSPQNLPPAIEVESKLVNQGEGPKMAGYPTLKYEVTANGKFCSENYLSEKAAKIPHVLSFLNALYEVSDSRKIKGIPAHPCQLAHDELEIEMMKLGVPMKSVRRTTNGNKVRHEIMEIKIGVTIKPEQLSLPKDYRIVSEETMIKQEQSEIQKRREQSQSQEEFPDERQR